MMQPLVDNKETCCRPCSGLGLATPAFGPPPRAVPPQVSTALGRHNPVRCMRARSRAKRARRKAHHSDFRFSSLRFVQSRLHGLCEYEGFFLININALIYRLWINARGGDK